MRKTILTRKEKMIEGRMDEYVPVGKKELKATAASIAASCVMSRKMLKETLGKVEKSSE